MDMTINIACATNRHYVRYTAVMLKSLFDNNPDKDFQLFILSGDKQIAQMKTFNDFLNTLDAGFKHVLIDDDYVKNFFPNSTRHVTPANYYRLFIPELIEADSVLYMDSDIVVVGDIQGLWQTPMDGKPIAAVKNYYLDRPRSYIEQLGLKRFDQYFNSGVLLFDRAAWQKRCIYNRIQDFLKNYTGEMVYADQDLLNAVLHDQWAVLDPRFNVMTHFYFPFVKKLYDDTRLSAAAQNPVIIHDTTPGIKFWNEQSIHPQRNRYFQYARQISWVTQSDCPSPSLTVKVLRLLRMIKFQIVLMIKYVAVMLNVCDRR